MGPSWRGAARGAAVVVAIVTIALTGVAAIPSAGAATASGPQPVTDYASYPQPAILGSCPQEGRGVLEGVSFSNGTRTAASLAGLGSLAPGTSVSMTWSRFAAGCDGVGVSLSIRRSDTPAYDPSTNHEVVGPFAYCGPEGDACTATAGRYGPLTVTLPPRTALCDYRLDAALGRPLAVAGPAGSYPDAAGRGHGADLAVDAADGTYGGCQPADPSAAAVIDCSADAVAVTLTNRGEVDAPFTVERDGTPLPPVEVGPNGSTRVDVPFSGADAVAVTVTSGSTSLFDRQPFPHDCGAPQAEIAPSCASGGAVVTLVNLGADPADLTVRRDGDVVQTVTLAGGGQASRVPVSIAEGATALVTVDDGNGTIASQQVTRHCTQPQVGAFRLDCRAGQFVADLANPGTGVSHVTATKAGQAAGSVDVPADGTATLAVPFAEGERAEVVVGADGTELTRAVLVRDCTSRTGAVVLDCAQGGAVVALTNSSDRVADFALLRDGAVTGVVTVQPHGTGSGVVKLAEDQRAVISARTSDGVEIGPATILGDCTQVQGLVLTRSGGTATAAGASGGLAITRSGGSTLPRTGTAVRPFLVLAGGLLLAGGLVFAASGRTRSTPWKP